jgi:cyclopropane-fatty-acyl-phospholipid synthase
MTGEWQGIAAMTQVDGKVDGTGAQPSSGAPIRVTLATVDDVAADLPFAVRQALHFAARLERGQLETRLPDGRTLLFEGPIEGPHAVMIINTLDFAKRLIGGGDVGIAEGYLNGDWESPDLTRFLQLFCVNHSLIARMLVGHPLARWWQLLQHFLNRNTRRGAKRNIHAHYDIGNRFYEAWLDRTMTYSSAMFERGDNDLSSAQMRKYRALAERIGIEPSHHVLEIGCGWGGFAEYAAREIGCRVTGLTISKEQLDYASARIAKAGLAEKVTLKLQDYRDERGVYDRIASIEMFEAVGEAYWRAFFRQLRDRLVAGGRAGLQVITIAEGSVSAYRGELDFIRRYIFPGGMLPSPSIMSRLGHEYGVPLLTERVFGHDYATTLAMWRERFFAAWPQLVPLGFDDKFRRMWEYYLSYCEAGFLAGNIDVRQMVFAKGA